MKLLPALILAVAATPALACSHDGVTDDLMGPCGGTLTIPSWGGHSLIVEPSCVTMPTLKLCPGDPPTVWMDPKAEPKDIARRLLEALVQLGFREQ